MILVKFTDYASEFVNGSLYMNPLEYFWRHGFEGQADVYEGLSEIIDIDKMRHMFSNDLAEYITRDIGIQSVDYSLCNILCMSRIDVEPREGFVKITAPNDMPSFGKKAVIITDLDSFLSRVNSAISGQGYQYVCEDVEYYNPTYGGKETKKKSILTWKIRTSFTINQMGNIDPIDFRDSFDKNERYSWQNEWRISLYRGDVIANAYILEIGDIHDITMTVDSKKMEDKSFIEQLLKKYNYDNPGYIGNVSRTDLRKLFQKSGKYWVLVNT